MNHCRLAVKEVSLVVKESLGVVVKRNPGVGEDPSNDVEVPIVWSGECPGFAVNNDGDVGNHLVARC